MAAEKVDQAKVGWRTDESTGREGPRLGGTKSGNTHRFFPDAHGVPRRRRRRPSTRPEGVRTDAAQDAPSVRPRATS